MKKNSIYIVAAAILGLLAGYLFFGNSSDGKEDMEVHDHSAHSETSWWGLEYH